MSYKEVIGVDSTVVQDCLWDQTEFEYSCVILGKPFFLFGPQLSHFQNAYKYMQFYLGLHGLLKEEYKSVIHGVWS